MRKYTFRVLLKEFLKLFKCLASSGDVAQNAAQEPIFYYSRPVHIGGPFKAYWVMGESLGADRFYRRSHRDPQLFMTYSRGLTICEYLSIEA